MKRQSNRIRTLVFFIVCAQCLPAVWSLPAQAQVDSADYVLWRRSLVSTAPPLPLPAVQIVRDSVWPVRTP